MGKTSVSHGTLKTDSEKNDPPTFARKMSKEAHYTGWCKSRGTVCSADCLAVVATRSIILAQIIPKPLL